MRWRPSLRAKQVGTFGISVTAGLGAATLAVRSPWTSCLHYGVIDSGGFLPVRLTFDHRVLDGATAARALVDLEAVLLGEVLDELRGLAQPAAA
jgi:pyruvate/2-oxoglutarate dehydrogenase complex dihydrolipoamide acyltransferase (E2) component